MAKSETFHNILKSTGVYAGSVIGELIDGFRILNALSWAIANSGIIDENSRDSIQINIITVIFNLYKFIKIFPPKKP